MELEGQQAEEPPIDTRPDVRQVFVVATAASASSALASIPEETEVENAVVPQAIRPRQPESQPGSETSERNVRPRVESGLTAIFSRS